MCAVLESVKQKSLNKKLTKGATSTLYGSAWEPPVGAKVEHTSEPVMMLAGTLLHPTCAPSLSLFLSLLCVCVCFFSLES